MSPPPWKRDVFVSFEENNRTFITSLFKRLHQVGIREVNTLPQSPQPKFAFALVVLSEKYFDPKGCLKELVKILDCKRDRGVVIIPIFYEEREKIIGSRSARKLTGDYERALAETVKIPGYELKAAKDKQNLIDKIIGRLVNEIHSRYCGEDFIFGPFGDSYESHWENRKTHEKPTDIKGIIVAYERSIKSITFKVGNNVSTVPQRRKNGQDNTYEVKLEDGEYITSFAGSKNANKGKIDYLTFRTNKRILGPIGNEKDKAGEYFSVPSDAGEVTEFFWSTDGIDFVDIGARVKLPSKKYRPVKSKSFGQEIGVRWDDGNQHTDIKKIIIQLNPERKRVIRSIEIHYAGKDEQKTHPEKGRRVDMPYEINLEIPDEYLTSISGWYTEAGITSVTFLTNKKRLVGTIGDEKHFEEEKHFSLFKTDCKIVGFYGWSDDHLRGIGAYFEPFSILYPIKSIGPFGGGDVWDDGIFNGVKEIYIDFNGKKSYIMFEYDDGSKDGCKIMHKHNDTELRPHAEKKVGLHYPQEYLTSISGYTGNDGSIQSLTFYTNRKICSIGRPKDGKYFGYPSTGSRIIGFYGTWAETLNSIGVYTEPIPHLYPFKIVRPFKGIGGIEWDDGVYTGVRGFLVSEHDKKIESITFKYDYNGSEVQGDRHGRRGGGTWIMLDYPKERLTTVLGYSYQEAGQTIIHDLEMRTTSTTTHYGPYAQGGGRKDQSSERFIIPKQGEEGRIVGFFGMAKEHLNFIGARLEHQ